MSHLSELLARLEAAITQLNGVLTGSATDTIDINGVKRVSLSKEVADGLAVIETSIAGLQSQISALSVGRLYFATKALMDADLSPAEPKLAEVYNDSNSALNGVYAKIGASGAGSWEPSNLDRLTALESRQPYLLGNQWFDGAGVLARAWNYYTLTDITHVTTDAYFVDRGIKRVMRIAQGFSGSQYRINALNPQKTQVLLSVIVSTDDASKWPGVKRFFQLEGGGLDAGLVMTNYEQLDANHRRYWVAETLPANAVGVMLGGSLGASTANHEYGAFAVYQSDAVINLHQCDLLEHPLNYTTGGAQVDNATLLAWALNESWSLTNPVYSNGELSSADITWPDGSSGQFTVTAYGTAVDAFTASHSDSGEVVSQASVTRNANGVITSRPFPVIVGAS